MSQPPVWLPSHAARPLLAWGRPQLEALASTIGQALSEWRTTWGLVASVPPMACQAGTTEAALHLNWHPLGEAAWVGLPVDTLGRLAQMLFQVSDAASPVATDVAEACARDAYVRLASVLRLGGALPLLPSPPPGIGRPWSGAVEAALPGTPGWLLVLGPESMQAWCSRSGVGAQDRNAPAAREPLCAATEALGARTVRLAVELSPCEIALGELQTLQIGDVVCLPHELEAPARLTDAQGRTVFDAFLVSHQGRKAVELAKNHVH